MIIVFIMLWNVLNIYIIQGLGNVVQPDSMKAILYGHRNTY